MSYNGQGGSYNKGLSGLWCMYSEFEKPQLRSQSVVCTPSWDLLVEFSDTANLQKVCGNFHMCVEIDSRLNSASPGFVCNQNLELFGDRVGNYVKMEMGRDWGAAAPSQGMHGTCKSRMRQGRTLS